MERQAKINTPDKAIKQAQAGLEQLKNAVIELIKANPQGIRNAEAAKHLGLKSDYGGGAQDYLSYSILGLLMKEGKVYRDADRRHRLTDEL